MNIGWTNPPSGSSPALAEIRSFQGHLRGLSPRRDPALISHDHPPAPAIPLHPCQAHLVDVHATPSIETLRTQRESLGEEVGMSTDAVTIESRDGREVLAASGAEVQREGSLFDGLE